MKLRAVGFLRRRGKAWLRGACLFSWTQTYSHRWIRLKSTIWLTIKRFTSRFSRERPSSSLSLLILLSIWPYMILKPSYDSFSFVNWRCSWLLSRTLQVTNLSGKKSESSLLVFGFLLFIEKEASLLLLNAATIIMSSSFLGVEHLLNDLSFKWMPPSVYNSERTTLL